MATNREVLTWREVLRVLQAVPASTAWLDAPVSAAVVDALREAAWQPPRRPQPPLHQLTLPWA